MRIGVLSDLHLAEPDTPNRTYIDEQPLGRSSALLGAALTRLAENGVDGFLLLGDLTEHGRASELAVLGTRLARQSTVWGVPGNHDLLGEADPESIGVHRPPATGIEWGPVRIAAGRVASMDGAGHVDQPPDPSCWPAGSLVVWLSHFPVLDTTGPVTTAGLRHAGDLANRAEVARSLHAHDGPVLVLAGHLHVQLVVAERNVLQLDHAALIERPHAFAVLDIAEHAHGFTLQWRTSTLQPRASSPINAFLARAEEHWSWQAGTWRTDEMRSGR